jgi:hypothetical protein
MKYKEFDGVTCINGHVVDVHYTVTVEEDDLDPSGDFDFGNVQENENYLKRFKNGELFIAIISVYVTMKDFDGGGDAVLGGNHIRSNNYFDSSGFNKDVEAILNEHGLIHEATKDLFRQVIDAANRLGKYLTPVR